MGNRAVITNEEKKLAVYLHWNGGRDSVRAFLTYCLMTKQRTPEEDWYGWARLCQIVGNFFPDFDLDKPNHEAPGTMSLGIGLYSEMEGSSDWDNGVYILKGWRIVGRERFKGEEQSEYDLLNMLLSIDKAQPIRLGEEFIKDWLANNQPVE